MATGKKKRNTPLNLRKKKQKNLTDSNIGNQEPSNERAHKRARKGRTMLCL
jgi:hypothetical protein